MLSAWDTISGPAGGGGQVAMDMTGSPWDNPNQAATTETGWADFGAFPSSGNDSGASDIIEQQPRVVMAVEDRPEEEEEEGGESWRPNMASSPEATMLDVTAEVAEGENQTKEDKAESKPDDESGKVINENDQGKESKKIATDERLLDEESNPENPNKEELADNFAFLSDKGLITSDNSINTSQSQE